MCGRGRYCMPPETDRHRRKVDLCSPMIGQLEIGNDNWGTGSGWVKTFVGGNNVCERKGVFV